VKRDCRASAAPAPFRRAPLQNGKHHGRREVFGTKNWSQPTPCRFGQKNNGTTASYNSIIVDHGEGILVRDGLLTALRRLIRVIIIDAVDDFYRPTMNATASVHRVGYG